MGQPVGWHKGLATEQESHNAAHERSDASATEQERRAQEEQHTAEQHIAEHEPPPSTPGTQQQSAAAAPTNPAGLDGTDRWLARLADGGRLRAGLTALGRAYPFVTAKLRADALVGEARLSEYEGMLQTDRHSIRYGSSAEVFLSVTRLEQYAQCPKRFLFSTVLKLRAKETAVYDRSRWLDAAQRGNLLHRIYYLYLAELADRAGEGPITHDEALLGMLTDRCLEGSGLRYRLQARIFIGRNAALYAGMSTCFSARSRDGPAGRDFLSWSWSRTGNRWR